MTGQNTQVDGDSMAGIPMTGRHPASPAARPVTPLTCPKCNALWLFWPKEQSSAEHDSLNLRSLKSCDYCESASADQLLSMNRVAPSASPAALTEALSAIKNPYKGKDDAAAHAYDCAMADAHRTIRALLTASPTDNQGN